MSVFCYEYLKIFLNGIDYYYFEREAYIVCELYIPTIVFLKQKISVEVVVMTLSVVVVVMISVEAGGFRWMTEVDAKEIETKWGCRSIL